ncbi:MAG: gamma-glutamyltransferase [Elusimicrobiota bacterium]
MKRLSLLLIAAALSGCAHGGLPDAPRTWGLEGREQMVAADHPVASEVGARILEAGGNAVDAAVATSLALAVTRPFSAGVGGGGFMLIKFRGKEPAILDYRETAPAAAVPAAYVDGGGEVIAGKTMSGHWAAGVPGEIRGLDQALRTYGTMELADVAAPAIELAETGFPVDAMTRKAMKRLAERLKELPDPGEWGAEIARIFLKDGKPYALGETLRQPDLAATLRAVAAEGPDALYRGRIAGLIAADMERHGGPMTADDLAAYEVKVRTPLRGRFRGFEVMGMPPPSSGGACLIQMLQVLDGYDPKELDAPSYYHFMVESMKHAFADRAAFLGDPDAQPEIAEDAAGMISPERAARARAAIRSDRTGEPTRYGVHWLKDDQGTTHYNVFDRHGNAVAATESINHAFGSLVVPPGTGVVLNDELDDFRVRVGAPDEFGLPIPDRNLIRPGHRPMSSMSPTLLLKDGEAVLAAGASGGPRIITATLQAIVNIVDFGLRPDEAVAAKRVHHQWSPDLVRVEEGLPAAIRMRLLDSGHRLARYKSHAGICQVIYKDGDVLYGASDPRKGGRPAGR